MRQYVLIILAAFFVTACGGKKTVDSGAAVQTIELSDSIIEYRGADTLDFGKIRRGERVVREFMVKNVGDKALVITQLDLSCGCVEAEYPMEPLMPQTEGAMSLTLDTEDLGGWVFKTIGVRTSLNPKPYTLCVMAEILNN